MSWGLNVQGPKHPGAEMSRGLNVLGPKRLGLNVLCLKSRGRKQKQAFYRQLIWGPSKLSNGYLLHCMHKQQDFFGCLAKILGCLGLREAANLEI